MDAGTAIALVMPPSVAWMWRGWMAWQQERDRKIAETAMLTLSEVTHMVANHRDELLRLETRIKETERHIGQLTDRSMSG